MYEVKYSAGEFWIYKNGKRVDELGGFIDPISPEIIIKEILDDRNNKCILD